MKILSFDTTNNMASVAVSVNDEIVAYEEELRSASQAENLIPMIEKALKYAGLKYRDIDYLGVTNGPGSFTGIRIGLAAAQGILLASKIKGIAVSNFDLAYYRAGQQVKTFDKIYIFLNAYRGQLYVKIYDKYAGESEPALIEIEEVEKFIEAHHVAGSVSCVAGSGLEFIKDKLDLMILPRFPRIKAMHICKYLNQSGPLNATSLEPLYIRLADAKRPIVF